jgi:hypothetical protein
LGVVTGAHLALLQLVIFIRGLSTPVPFRPLAISGAVLGGLFAILGVLMTLRHRRLMDVKISWIYRAEDALGLVADKDDPDSGIIPYSEKFKSTPKWNGLGRPRFLSTGWLILCFYMLLLIIDFASVWLFATL